MVKIQGNSDELAVKISIQDHVARVLIDRAAKKNAVTRDMWTQIASLFTDAAGNSEIRAIVISGAGADFCAGADIGEFDAARSDTSTAKDYEAANDDAFAAIRRCPVPVIAAIRGICFGGGFGIAAATDIRIGTRDSTYSVPAAKLGLAYPAIAMADIVNAVGPQMAKYLTFSASRIDAKQALTAGFLHEIVDGDDLEQRTGDLARTIAANAPLSVRASKASIRAALTNAKEDLASAEALGKQTFNSIDYAEGRAAFAEKRKPKFVGH